MIFMRGNDRVNVKYLHKGKVQRPTQSQCIINRMLYFCQNSRKTTHIFHSIYLELSIKPAILPTTRHPRLRCRKIKINITMVQFSFSTFMWLKTKPNKHTFKSCRWKCVTWVRTDWRHWFRFPYFSTVLS